MIKNLNTDGCLKLLGENYIGRLGFVSGQSPCVIPITYFHDAEEKCIISYSFIGHKLESMRRFPAVSLQVDNIADVHHWQSVLIQGRFEELKGSTAKKYLHKFAQGVQKIIEDRQDGNPKSISDFSANITGKEAPVAYLIRINNISGKYRESK
ncbi:pyridoxamine 5'-phosphate oxidase family protein [Cytophaga sp. FL35]|uniref:pyridoxamine 5'-phosphate oxidase family protein n=1 Tax=Cytophaga sp. FL35 TaxID=1904456 RepID=UPI001653607D|nr:pyridoxamine 5'-phosphate oxidase family protein [Cytophaga sp. FL35]MBC7000289.1 pyridoxamine 5'-phosphate oxidase family protein [Cytophaga sp. FL35]